MPVKISAELAESITKRASNYDLPTYYATVPVSFLDAKRGKCPPASPINQVDINTREMEMGWLDTCLKPETCIPWATFHSESDTKRPKVRLISNFTFNKKKTPVLL